MRQKLTTDEHRVMAWQIHMLLSLAHDARALVVHDRLVEVGEIDPVFGSGPLVNAAGTAYLECFLSVMRFVGCDEVVLAPFHDLRAQNGRLSSEISKLNVEIAQLKSTLAIRDGEIKDLYTAIDKTLVQLQHDREIAGIPF